MKVTNLLAFLVICGMVPTAHAQFGSGIMYDPTQSAHAAQQILQANKL
jgi:hypothetical protein